MKTAVLFIVWTIIWTFIVGGILTSRPAYERNYDWGFQEGMKYGRSLEYAENYRVIQVNQYRAIFIRTNNN